MIVSAFTTLERIRRWVRRHPRITAVLVVAAVMFFVDAVGTSLAIADNTGPDAVPWLPPTAMVDQDGVTLLQYNMLPLDRGDAWTLQKGFWTNPTDTLWTMHLMGVAWSLWMFEFQLSFQWVDWITGPISAIADFAQTAVTQIGWVPLAMAITGLVCGIAILTGRIGSGIAELLISAVCLALSLGILLNPVASLSGPNGAIVWSATQGGNLAAAIASDDPVLPTDEPSLDDAQRVLSGTITTQLMDIFVRRPAQEIAFGHQLEGSCATTFSEQMKTVNPLDKASTSVRDAVKGCDQAAWDYVTNPGAGMLLTTAVIWFGSGALILLADVFALMLLIVVLYALWCAAKLIILVPVNLLPGFGRTALFKSLIGMWVGVLSVGGAIILLAGYLRVLSGVMGAASDVGIPMLAQTLLVNMVVLALIVTFFVAWAQARRAGETLAARLGRIGFSGGGAAAARHSNPVLQSAKRLGEHYVLEKMRKAPQIEAAGNTYNVLNVGGGGRPAAGADLGEVPATTSAASGGAGRLVDAVGVASTAKKALAAGTAAGAAVGSGGTSAVVMTVAKVAGKQVLQRAITEGGKKALTAGSRPDSTGSGPVGTEAPTFRGFGRQIVVDSNGHGSVRPVEAPERGGVYTVTSMPPRPTADDGELRQRLAAAAARKELTA